MSTSDAISRKVEIPKGRSVLFDIKGKLLNMSGHTIYRYECFLFVLVRNNAEYKKVLKVYETEYEAEYDFLRIEMMINAGCPVVHL